MKPTTLSVSKPGLHELRRRRERAPRYGADSAQPSKAATGHIPALAAVMPQLERLKRLDNWRNVLYVGEDWLVVIGAVGAAEAARNSSLGPFALLFAIVLIGSRMRALMNLVHQASHGQLFENEVLNRWVGRTLVAWPLLVSVVAYREEHQQHHVKLWDQLADPKVHRLVRLGLVAPEPRRLAFVIKHIVGPMTLLHAPRNVAGALGTSSERVGRSVFVVLCGAATVLLGVERELILYWVVPYITSFQVMRYWAEMAEHSGLASDRPWSATRNWTAALPIRWLLAPHSDHWHLVHHLYSLVPHYRLAEAHRVLMRVPQYADEGHHCDGLIFAHRPDAPSVISDVMNPDNIDKYRPTRATLGARLTEVMRTGESVDAATTDAVLAYFEELRSDIGWQDRHPEPDDDSESRT